MSKLFIVKKSKVAGERKQELILFQKNNKLGFKSLDLLNLSFIHCSRSNEEQNNNYNNERLEFLGDSILGHAVANMLYKDLEDKLEGELSKIKGYLVSEPILSEIALDIGIDKMLLLGKGEEKSGGRKKQAILADSMEALLGAFFLDSGYEACIKFIERIIQPHYRKIIQNKHMADYKSELQELAQKLFGSCPIYSVVKKTGPDHDKTYWISCILGNSVYGPSSGKNKKAAEQAVAMSVLQQLKSENITT